MHPDSSAGSLEDSDGIGSSDHSHVPRSSDDFQEEKAELEWILAQPEISRSASLVRFLSFICSKYFEGELKEIREHTIAVQALGRKESTFDSHDDPIVRVTARTLRKKLQLIYHSDGRNRELQIVLPLGRYVPQFVHAADAGAGAALLTEGPNTELMPAEASFVSTESEIAGNDEDAASHERPSVKRTFTLLGQWRGLFKIAAMILLACVIFFGGYFLGRHGDQDQHPVRDSLKWGDPIWSDEFDGAAHQLPDSSKWGYDLEDQGGLANGDRVAFCSPADKRSKECDPHKPNAFQDGAGHLVLRAQKNANGTWTLVRLTTKAIKNFQYGRIEARMKLPVGAGLWPSFVMVGEDKDTVGWPACGSMDVVENVSLTPSSNGLGPTMIRATLHGPRYFGSNGLWHDFRLPNGGRVDDAGFHTYGIIWSPDMVQFYVDDPSNVYVVHDASELPEGGTWVFDHPFFLTLGLAVGGDWAGHPTAATPNPADMVVDFVRSYKIPRVQAPNIAWQQVPVKAGSSAASTISLRSPSYAGRVHLSCATDTPTTSCSLATSIVNFSDTLSQEDTITLSTSSFTERGRVVASPGRYKVTITATTISGDRSSLTVPFEVKSVE